MQYKYSNKRNNQRNSKQRRYCNTITLYRNKPEPAPSNIWTGIGLALMWIIGLAAMFLLLLSVPESWL